MASLAHAPRARRSNRRAATPRKLRTPAPVGMTRAESMARTRQAVLEAASRTFAAHGYAGATLDAIAAAAGFTKGAVYTHFESKQALFLALLSDRLAQDAAALRAIVERGRSEPAALTRDFGDWLDGLDASGITPLLGVELEIEARRNPDVGPVFAALYTEHVAAIGAVLEQLYAVERRPPPMPVAALAAAALALVLGLALGRATGIDAAIVPAGEALRALLRLPAAKPQ